MAGLLSTQLNPTTSTGQFIGDALSGLGAGLLAYGGGGYLRPQAGMIGLQALQAAPQVRQERLMQNLQYQLGNQQLQQGAVTNALNNAQTLAMINWRNSKLGFPQVTMSDFQQNPSAVLSQLYGGQPQTSTQSFTNPQPVMSPMASSSTPGPIQSRPLPSMNTAQNAPMSGVPGIPQTPMPQMPQSSGQPSMLTPDVQTQIQNDALFNPEYAKMELSLIQAGLPYQQASALAKTMGEKEQFMGPNGLQNLPGAVPSQAQMAGGISGAQSQAQLPSQMALQSQRGAIERMNDINKLANTPYTQTVQTGPATFQQLNTNQLAAARGATPGEMKYTPEQSGNQQKLTDYKAALTDSSNEAQGQNVQLNQMLDTMRGFSPSRVADYTASLQAWMNGLGLSSDEQNKALSNYQEFTKMATKLSTSQARQLGAREAASVIQMVVRNNPNAQMTPTAITDMLNAMKASNDYAIAKNQAGDQYYQQFGTMNGFDAAYQKQHPPVEALAPYLRPEQLTGELGKAALPYLSNDQLIQLRQSMPR